MTRDFDDPNATDVRQLRLIGRDRTVLALGLSGTDASTDDVDAVADALRERGCQVLAHDSSAGLAGLAGSRFDVVLVGGLERTDEPGRLLTEVAGLLADDGYVVAAVPNIAHGSVRLALLEGRWDYGNRGLLDRASLRFFTRAGMDALFAESGLRIEHTERSIVSPFDLDPLLNLADFPPAVLEMVAEDAEASTVHFVVAAVPADRPAGALVVEPEPSFDDDADADADATEVARLAGVAGVAARVGATPATVAVLSEPAEVVGPQPGIEDVRALAFYLPQFHPIPENDAWWGTGFTEWSNVTRAQPVWPGHYQPRRPADLGYYDLRLPEVREAQAALAAANGITGFCYHHYWFGGRRLLQRPFEEVLESGTPGLPFALCWANESWSRVWDGDHAVLVEQDYNDDELRRHAAWLARPFNDPRYLTVDDRPIFVIYRVSHLPGPKAYVEKFRAACVEETGRDPYLIQAVTHELDKRPDQTGCDAEVEFPPHRLGDRVRAHVDPRLAAASHQRYEYEDVITGCLERLDVPWVRHPCVVPGWDNTARRKVRATILHGAEPESYGKWLLGAAEHEARRRPRQGLVFVNAWNEWAEGAYLEPDQRFGHGYLEATRRVFGPTSMVDVPRAAAVAGAALPADYLAMRQRVVELEREMATAFAKGEKAGRATDERRATVYSREVTRLNQLVVEIQHGAKQTGDWAVDLERQLKDRATQMDDLGHWARSMEVEIEAKNQVLGEAATYARNLEAQIADRDRRLHDLTLQLRHTPNP